MPEAYGYLRVSGPDQVHGDGFPRQRAAIEKYAASAGLTIAGWYQEQVEGWRDTDERVALATLFEDAKAEGGAKVFIFEALHRLARDLMVQEAIIADARKREITPISATEGPELCSADLSRTLMRQILGAFNQYEKGMIVAKLKAARERMKARGERCEGRKPYGQTHAEMAAVRRIRQLREQGLKLHGIAERLNAEAVPTRRPGARWSTTQVHRILQRRD